MKTAKISTLETVQISFITLVSTTKGSSMCSIREQQKLTLRKNKLHTEIMNRRFCRFDSESYLTIHPSLCAIPATIMQKIEYKVNDSLKKAK